MTAAMDTHDKFTGKHILDEFPVALEDVDTDHKAMKDCCIFPLQVAGFVDI